MNSNLPAAIELCWRLGLACILGLALGIERALRSKEAGPRTHSLITIGAALFMILSKYAFFDLAGEASNSGMDGSMIACQIVNGVNFIGAGLIFKGGRYNVSGLTSATGIWFSAAIGMACGCGLVPEAIFATAFIIFIQWFFHRHKIGGSSLTMQTLQLTVLNTPHIWRVLYRQQRRYGMEILSAKVERLPHNQLALTLKVTTEEQLSFKKALRLMDQQPEIKSIST